MKYQSFEEFALFEKLGIPKVDFATKILWDLKHNYFALYQLAELQESDMIDLMNVEFAKHKIAFAPIYDPPASVREMTTKEWANVGVGGAMTLLDGNIVIIILPKFFENFDKQYNDRLFKRFVATIAEVIGHEMIHREQLSRMNPKYLEELAKGEKGATVGKEMDAYGYYSNPQEIAAFANQTIDDLVRHKFKLDIIKDFLKDPQSWIGSDPEKWSSEKNFKKFSMAYIMYYQLFKDVDDKIWQKYLKQCYYFLDKVKY